MGMTFKKLLTIGRSVRATRLEKTQPLPGDEVIPRPIGSLTYAITIEARRENVWPWLVQMGAGRAGWYSYDALDNEGRRSADRILPWCQTIGPGVLFPALPRMAEGFFVIKSEPEHWLILGWPAPDGSYVVSWAFVLREESPNRTRLIVRARGDQTYSFHGLPQAIGMPLARVVHFIMERKQLLGIRKRVEAAQMVERRHAA